MTIAINGENTGRKAWLGQIVAEETEIILPGFLLQDDIGVDPLSISHEIGSRNDYIGVLLIDITIWLSRTQEAVL